MIRSSCRSRLIRLGLASVAVGVLVSGCGDADTSPLPTSANPAAETDDAQAESGQRTGTVPTDPAPGRAFSNQAQAGTEDAIDFAAYVEGLDLALAALNTYWSETLETDFGVAWIEPFAFIAYDGGDGPACGGVQVGPQNAVYCAPDDYIAWDEVGLMLPIYEAQGDMATAVVLAHEFGHGVQARLGEVHPLTIESELQADCFAGSWAAWADDFGLLGEDAARQAIEVVVFLGDAEGVPWTDPDAHGTPGERLKAFSDGLDLGAQGCYEVYAPGFSSGE